MGATTITDVTLLYGAHDVSPFTGQFDTGQTTAMHDAPNCASGGFQVRLPGLVSVESSLSGWADFASGAINSVFAGAQRGRQDAFTIIPSGSQHVEGSPAIFTRGLLAAYKPLSGETGAVAGFTASMTGDTAEVYGVVAVPHAVYDDNGFTGAGVELGAVGTGPTGIEQQLWAAIHVTGADGADLEVVIESDNADTFGSATARIEFALMSAPGWQFMSVPGPIADDWYRAVVTIDTDDEFTLAVVMGVW